jgi:dimethylhistidine N-methyltransferase
MACTNERVKLIRLDGADGREEFLTEVIAGLCAEQKHLPCRFFYDDRGSRLFEEICRQPEYYPTDCERHILRERSGDIVADLRSDSALVELGSGSADKTRLLIESFLERFGRFRYVPIDISEGALRDSAAVLLDAYPRLEVHALVADYSSGLRHIQRAMTAPGLIAWLGSSVGNFDRSEAAGFLRDIRDGMKLNDRFLMGVDLIKERSVLEAAYNDAAGVTARFNKNILRRINRELGGYFDLDQFEHRAIWNEDESRIEMHLVSRRRQTVHIDAADLSVTFKRDETIHTENSHKYAPDQVEALAEVADLRLLQQWTDPEAFFSVNVLAPKGG